MMEKKRKRIETVCAAGIVMLSVFIVLCVLSLGAGAHEDDAGQPAPAQTQEAAASLAEGIGWLPDAVCYGRKLPVTTFRAADGSKRSLDDYAGKKLMLLFWGSWCSSCDRVLRQWQAYAAALLEHPDYALVLINKLDAGKGETVEKAQAYLTGNAIPFESLYDESLRAYKACGVKRIPTLLVLDERGYLRYMTTDVPASGPELRALFAYAESGGAADTERFLTEHMIGEDGGVYTAYLGKRGAAPAGHDVLSESQGLLMEYAALTRNRTLFEQSWRYAREKLYRDGLFAWYATEAGEQANANALIDDLRIYRALKAADALWGGYEAEYAALADAILTRNVSRGQPVGFYDFRQKRAGSVIPLFFLDMEALRDMGLLQRAEDILRGGYISDAFPLYRSAYDHSSRTYAEDSLNTSEALMTLYHAAQAGLAGQASLDWLERQVVSGALAARYDLSGQPVKGFDYHSTAAYAIAALIGAQSGNARLYTYARHRMETYRVAEPSALQGSFSSRGDGSDIIAFDQLMPLLVYAATRDITFDD